VGNVGETHEVEWEYLCFCICTIVLVKPVAEYLEAMCPLCVCV
jgi:hypothetical protein